MGRPSTARAKLIEASQDLFWQHGYEHVSVEDICQQTGVNKGSFYYFFKTKKDLALQANAERWAEIQKLQIVDPQNPDPLHTIIQYFRSVIQSQADAQKNSRAHIRGCPFGFLGAELSGLEPEVALQIQEIFDAYIKFIEQNLRLARKQGLIEAQNLASIARQIFTIWQGSLLLARVYNKDQFLKEGLKTTEQLLRRL